MKKTPILFFSTLSTFFFSFSVFSQPADNFCKKAQQLIGDFKSFHVRPIETNESTSKEIAELLIDNIDPKGVLLKEPDLKLLREKSNSLFIEIYSNKTDYLTLTTELFKRSLQFNDSIYNLLLSKPLDFNEKDSITFIAFGGNPFYSPNITYHAKRLRRYVKSLCLDKATTLYKDSLSEKDFYEKANKLKETIINRLRKKLQTQLNNVQQEAETILLNSLALRYDPHSNFFTYSETKKYKQALSAYVESFGFMLNENNNGEAEISYISPGGSAWVSNEINVGDILLSISLNDKTYSNDEYDTEELERNIDETNEKTIVLQIKKKNGATKNVTLIKRKTQSDENFVKGYILKANKAAVGYINLPSFYVEMNNASLPGCSNDVAKEIVKLENDSIEGLILDLRNNGGGSMQEAINLAGIFINEGPLFIYKETKQKPYLMKDINRGSVFKKPIIVLINAFSASASELFCNIMKDYNRGVIVGQTSYGKGTAQVIFPLDTNLIEGEKIDYNKQVDYVKVTNGRFYRLNNSTHQGIGVVPDIKFPSFSMFYASYQESKSPHYIYPDWIQKKVIYTPLPSLPLELLLQKSSARQKASSDFQNYTSCSDSIQSAFRSSKSVALNYKSYFKHNKQSDKLIERIENISVAKTNVIKTYNNTFDKKLYELDSLLNDFNNRVLKSITEDIFINEAYLIINDIITP